MNASGVIAMSRPPTISTNAASAPSADVPDMSPTTFILRSSRQPDTPRHRLRCATPQKARQGSSGASNMRPR